MSGLPHESFEVVQCYMEFLEATRAVQMLETHLRECEDWMFVFLKTSYTCAQHVSEVCVHVLEDGHRHTAALINIVHIV